MSGKKQVRYKVETYIVPQTNNFQIQYPIDEIENINITNQLKINEENICSHNEFIDGCSLEDSKSIGVNIIEDLENNTETTLNATFNNDNIKYCNNAQNYYFCEYPKSEFYLPIKSQNMFYPVKQFKKVNSLMSIDEKSENCEVRLNEFCYHGYKNGCTATISSPEEVSEEIFKENWLQKIEILRQREAIVKEKEVNLQCTERQLFKREKKIRITERVLKDKLKQIELQLKYLKDIRNSDIKLEEVERIPEISSFSESKEFQEFAKINPSSNAESINSCEKNRETDKKTRNLVRSKSSSLRQSSLSNEIIYNSMKHKQRPKVSYDDLNSTLSADIGDSSFVQTSAKFNPAIYKKPYAFTRSASERWTKQKDSIISSKSQDTFDVEEKPQYIEEEKVLKKISENISASQDKNARFQDYGLIDCRTDDTACVQGKMENVLGNERRFSYLNLEVGRKFDHQKLANNPKQRPNSWNEKTDEWLQKKRQAYNQTTQPKTTVNKENLKCNTNIKKISKSTKKNVKKKILTVFR